ncbi:Uncharacterized protein Adt_17241 [Abeliophyllum distichum]|uniref:Uncharacterized protein n=1 Tax=Abeliophyllum distichum TaxID=126358 RepID=A0ABD1TFX5_9LAMI
MGENATLTIKEAIMVAIRITIRTATGTKERLQRTNLVLLLEKIEASYAVGHTSHCKADFEEDEDVVSAFSYRCSTILHRVIEKGEVSQKKVEKKELKSRVCKAKDLMYIDVKINGKPIKTMVDTVATHNYLTSPEIELIRLVLEKVQMNDFKLILGLKFFWDTKTAILPFSNSLMMMESKSCVIPMLVGKMGEKNISAMQFSMGFKQNELSFLCTLHLEEIEEATGTIPKPVRRLLQEFEDIMPEKFPRRL